jgi:hypothetical protein
MPEFPPLLTKVIVAIVVAVVQALTEHFLDTE